MTARLLRIHQKRPIDLDSVAVVDHLVELSRAAEYTDREFVQFQVRVSVQDAGTFDRHA